MSEPEYDSWKLEVPWLPVSLNVWMRSHFAAQGRMAHTAGIILKPYLRVVLDDLGIRGPLPWKALMEFEVFARKVRDDDNVVVARKILLDSMKKLNFLADDDPTHVRSIDLPCQVDRSRPRTVIRIRRAE